MSSAAGFGPWPQPEMTWMVTVAVLVLAVLVLAATMVVS